MIFRNACFLLVCVLLPVDLVWAEDSAELIVGPNVNMVSGNEWPNGDPFLRQQNEPSVAFSSRNKLHLLAGANDYRSVDIPGLPDGRETGDSWPSYFWSSNGGASWQSTLIPGYPQGDSSIGDGTRNWGYEAGADPVVRAGSHGLFYYSGILFERGDNAASAVFVSRFIDLNNDEGGQPIRFIDTVRVDFEPGGDDFLDKPWMAVDIPRPGDPEHTFAVTQRDGSTVSQTVQCGAVYVAYASIGGTGANMRSTIKLTTSLDCGQNWSDPVIVSQADTLNQGANVAITPETGEVNVAWRRFSSVAELLGEATFGCPAKGEDWRKNPDDWPISSVTLGDVTYSKEDAIALMKLSTKGREQIKLIRTLIPAKLNLLTGGGPEDADFDRQQWIEDIGLLIAEADAWLEEHPLGSPVDKGVKHEGQDIEHALKKIYMGSGKCKKSKKSKKSEKSEKSEKSDKSKKSKKSSKSKKSGDEEQSDPPEESEVAAGGSPTGGTDQNQVVIGTTNFTNAIMFNSSAAGGAAFGVPEIVAEITTFDQGSTNFSFRTTAYPSITVDAVGRAYVAFAARGFATLRSSELEGDARIMVATSVGGSAWTLPRAIDKPGVSGHQIKPSLLFAGGRLVLVYYDFRQDVSNLFERFIVDLPEANRLRHTMDVRVAVALPGDEPQFTDYSVLSAPSEEVVRFVDPSRQATRYPFMVTPGESGKPSDTYQLQYLTPNMPTHAAGSTPFVGDYVDVSAPRFVLNLDGSWRFATEPGDADIFQVVWTDNRDIRPPPDGDWSRYVVPVPAGGVPADRTSIFDPDKLVDFCISPEDKLYTGTRNQNIYTTTLARGLIVAAPDNNRLLTETIERGFVIYTQNVTDVERIFRLTIIAATGVDASFDQTQTINSLEVIVPPFSSTVRTIYVTSSNQFGTVPVEVVEIDENSNEIVGGLRGAILINGDPTAPPPLSLGQAEIRTPAIFNPAILNPAILNPAILNPAIFNPAIMNPAIFNPAIFNPAILNPAILNPAILNPAIFNPAIFNPAIMNPAILNPAIFNPAILNPAIFNPAILNPAIFNPAIMNPAILNPAILNPAIYNTAVSTELSTDVISDNIDTDAKSAEFTFGVRNDGNTTTSYDVNLAVDTELEGVTYQILVYRLYETPVADECSLITEAQQELVANVSNANVNPRDLLDGTAGPGSPSFYLEPGDEILVTLRVLPDPAVPDPGDPTDPDVGIAVEDISGVVVSQPTPPPPPQGSPPPPPVADGFVGLEEVVPEEFEPLVISGVSISAITGITYNQTFTAIGGRGAASTNWSVTVGQLPAGLTLNAASGQLGGIPTDAGSSSFVITANDGIQQASLLIQVSLFDLIDLVTDSLDMGIVGKAFDQTLQASGGAGDYNWQVVGNSLPAGLALSSGGVISGSPTVSGDFQVSIQVSDSSPQNPVQTTLAMDIDPLLVITTTTLPAAIAGQFYSEILQADGGDGALTWSFVSGSGALVGFSVQANGTITGPGAVSGQANLTVAVTDGIQTAQKLVTWDVFAPLVITSTTLNTGQVGSSFSQALTASGGTAVRTWSLDSGTLQAGLGFDVPTGTVSGTPTEFGTRSLVFKVLDGVQTAFLSADLTVLPALAIDTIGLAPGIQGNPYNETLVASGGTGSYEWQLLAGALPSGLNISTTGLISGTPTQSGSFTPTFEVDDGVQLVTTQLTIVVVVAAVGTYSDINGMVGSAAAWDRTLGTLTFTPPSSAAFACGTYAPMGTAADRALCWNFNQAETGSYTLSGSFGSANQQVDASSTLALAGIDDVSVNLIGNGVKFEWTGDVAQHGSFLVRMWNATTNSTTGEKLVSIDDLVSGSGTLTLPNVVVLPNNRYQTNIFSFNADLTKSEPLPGQFNASASAHRTIAVTPELGGTGGGNFALDCPVGYVGTGLIGRAGDDIDRTELRCREVVSTSAVLGGEVSGGAATNNGGGAAYSLRCASDEVLTGVRLAHGNVTAGLNIVDRLGARCTTFNGVSTTTSPLVGNPSFGLQEVNLDCPAGMSVTGVRGGQGFLMDRIQLVCTEMDFTRVTLDGVISANEWNNAATYSLLVNLPGGGTAPATVYLQNDDVNLYVAMKFARTVTDTGNSLAVEFDNDNDGIREDGDDVILFSPGGGLSDNYRVFCGQSLCGPTDTSDGGTNDGAGAFQNDGAFTTYEMSHPLDSSDDAHDFSLVGGDKVGFYIDLRMIQSPGNFPADFGDTRYPQNGFIEYQVTQ